MLAQGTQLLPTVTEELPILLQLSRVAKVQSEPHESLIGAEQGESDEYGMCVRHQFVAISASLQVQLCPLQCHRLEGISLSSHHAKQQSPLRSGRSRQPTVLARRGTMCI